MKYLLVLLTFITFEAKAWGPSGQQLTVRIAEKYLSPQARLKIDLLLSGKRLSDLATWADQVRRTSEWSQTGSWHYIDMPDFSKGAPDDIVEAIELARENLSTDMTSGEHLVWLKFLIHFVGDIHQPLHIGRPEDRGGNNTRVKFKGKSVNLHALWDGVILEDLNLNLDAYEKRLVSQNRTTIELSKSFDTSVVVEENFKNRAFVYSFSGNVIDPEYSAKALGIIDERLWTGGIRLAAALNEALKR